MKKGTFRLMPDRAFADKELSATDYRVLAAIAFFDRGGANGRGCFATQSTIAVRAGCQREEASRSISKLRDHGHITMTASSSKDARRRTIHLVYDEVEMSTNSATHSANMCNNTQEEPQQKQGGNEHKDILLNAEGYAVETGPNRISAPKWSDEKILSIEKEGAFLAILDREVRQGRLFQRDIAGKIYERLNEIYDAYTECGDPIGGRAYSLLETDIEEEGYDGRAHG